MSQIGGKTQVCAVIGHPIGHSLSPAIHNAGFQALGLDYVYVAHDVLPDAVAPAIAGMRALGYRGLSVTIPHKIAAMACVDEVDDVARGIGCINTILNDGGRLYGRNSDGQGALNALRAAGLDPVGARVLVLGSGGAARAVAMTLSIEAPPERMAVLGVVPDELERLVSDLRERRSSRVEGIALTPESSRTELGNADIVLQCTPVGMHPNVDQSPVDASALSPRLAVFDAVYNPKKTRLLRDAEAVGCTIVPGLEMFLGQALVQFELWTGQRAPQDVMRKVLEERL